MGYNPQTFLTQHFDDVLDGLVLIYRGEGGNIYKNLGVFQLYVYSFCGIAEILGEVFTVFSYLGKDMYCLYR